MGADGSPTQPFLTGLEQDQEETAFPGWRPAFPLAVLGGAGWETQQRPGLPDPLPLPPLPCLSCPQDLSPSRQIIVCAFSTPTFHRKLKLSAGPVFPSSAPRIPKTTTILLASPFRIKEAGRRLKVLTSFPSSAARTRARPPSWASVSPLPGCVFPQVLPALSLTCFSLVLLQTSLRGVCCVPPHWGPIFSPNHRVSATQRTVFPSEDASLYPK